jgi:hypothetical protein
VRRPPRILIRGAGMAGITAATLLARRGADVRISGRVPSRGRIVAIPIETVTLATDLLGIDIAALRIGPMVDRRLVDWSAEGPSVTPQVALVCDAARFAEAVAAPLRARGCLRDGEPNDDADWILEASGRAGGGFGPAGDRVGQFARLPEVTVEREVTVTAVTTGWIFTAPHPAGGLAVLLVSPSASACAADAEAVVDCVSAIGVRVPAQAVSELGRPEPVAPSLARPLWTGNRLLVGDAALALDPLGGDGLGFALRGALLAQAVLAAIETGSDRARCLAHYSDRLRRAFLSHIRACRTHYQAARHAGLWKRDVAAMDDVAVRLEAQPGAPEFRIEGRDLVPVLDA